MYRNHARKKDFIVFIRGNFKMHSGKKSAVRKKIAVKIFDFCSQKLVHFHRFENKLIDFKTQEIYLDWIVSKFCLRRTFLALAYNTMHSNQHGDSVNDLMF